MMHPASDDDAPVSLPAEELRQPLRLSLLLWLLGLPGVVGMAWQVGQRLPSGHLPGWALPVMGSVQSLLLLAAAVFFGAWLSPRVGLGAPMLGSLVQRRSRPVTALQQMWLPGVAGGVMGAAWMVTLAQLTPDALAPGDPVQALPLWIKLLYSGVAEELLVRWGMMSVMLFGLWRMLQPRGGAPRSGLVWMVIALAALLGAASNLPAAMALMGGLSPELLAYVLLNHTVFGLLAGYIYWRHGLGAAIVAHTLALALSHGLT